MKGKNVKRRRSIVLKDMNDKKYIFYLYDLIEYLEIRLENEIIEHYLTRQKLKEGKKK